MSSLQLLALLFYGAFLLGAVKHIDFSHFARNKQQQHLIFGTAVSLFVLWLFKAGIFEGLDVHFLGLSVLTLMLGFRNAIIAQKERLTKSDIGLVSDVCQSILDKEALSSQEKYTSFVDEMTLSLHSLIQSYQFQSQLLPPSFDAD